MNKALFIKSLCTVLFGLFAVHLPLHVSAYTNSYMSRYIDTQTYHTIREDFIDACSKPQDRACHREKKAAVEFIVAMGVEQQPDLNVYSAMDSYENPFAVLWAQCFEVLEGDRQSVEIPKDFRHLKFIMPLGVYMNNDEHRTTIGELFLKTLLKADKSVFTQKYYDSSYEAPYHALWSVDIPTCMRWVAHNKPDVVIEFVDALMYQNFEIGRWLWDKDFSTHLTNYVSYIFEDKFRIETHISQTNQVERRIKSTPLEVTRYYASLPIASALSIKTLDSHFKERAKVYYERYVRETDSMVMLLIKSSNATDADRADIHEKLKKLYYQLNQLSALSNSGRTPAYCQGDTREIADQSKYSEGPSRQTVDHDAIEVGMDKNDARFLCYRIFNRRFAPDETARKEISRIMCVIRNFNNHNEKL